MRSVLKHIPKAELKKIVSQSQSRSEVFRRLGMRKSGSTFGTLDKYIKQYDIDIRHFKRGNQSGNQKIPLSEILVENSTYNATELKKRLLKEGILKNECMCGIKDSWNGNSLVLHLDHINGNRNDHRIENLRLLCPNCHSQTPTFGFKNRNNLC